MDCCTGQSPGCRDGMTLLLQKGCDTENLAQSVSESDLRTNPISFFSASAHSRPLYGPERTLLFFPSRLYSAISLTEVFSWAASRHWNFFFAGQSQNV